MTPDLEATIAGIRAEHPDWSDQFVTTAATVRLQLAAQGIPERFTDAQAARLAAVMFAGPNQMGATEAAS